MASRREIIDERSRRRLTELQIQQQIDEGKQRGIAAQVTLAKLAQQNNVDAYARAHGFQNFEVMKEAQGAQEKANTLKASTAQNEKDAKIKALGTIVSATAGLGSPEGKVALDELMKTIGVNSPTDMPTTPEDETKKRLAAAAGKTGVHVQPPATTVPKVDPSFQGLAGQDYFDATGRIDARAPQAQPQNNIGAIDTSNYFSPGIVPIQEPTTEQTSPTNFVPGGTGGSPYAPTVAGGSIGATSVQDRRFFQSAEDRLADMTRGTGAYAPTDPVAHNRSIAQGAPGRIIPISPGPTTLAPMGVDEQADVRQKYGPKPSTPPLGNANLTRGENYSPNSFVQPPVAVAPQPAVVAAPPQPAVVPPQPTAAPLGPTNFAPGTGLDLSASNIANSPLAQFLSRLLVQPRTTAETTRRKNWPFY